MEQKTPGVSVLLRNQRVGSPDFLNIPFLPEGKHMIQDGCLTFGLAPHNFDRGANQRLTTLGAFEKSPLSKSGQPRAASKTHT